MCSKPSLQVLASLQKINLLTMRDGANVQRCQASKVASLGLMRSFLPVSNQQVESVDAFTLPLNMLVCVFGSFENK